MIADTIANNMVTIIFNTFLPNINFKYFLRKTSILIVAITPLLPPSESVLIPPVVPETK